MKNLSWKQWLLLLLAIPVVQQVASFIGSSLGRYVNQRETISQSPSIPDTSPSPIRVIVSSQDAEGVTSNQMDIEFLRRLEQYMVTSIKEKVRKGRAAQGYSGPDLDLQAESVFVEAGSNKLAVVRLRGSDNSFSVFLFGIVGNELRKVACTRAHLDPIPITNGPCSDKVKEVFGAGIGS